jgi:hypothetical protein
MSNFTCSRCGIANIDSPTGYVAGCQHYPPDNSRCVLVSFDGETFRSSAFYSGIDWYRSMEDAFEHRAIHPVAWRAEPADKTTQFSPQEMSKK